MKQYLLLLISWYGMVSHFMSYHSFCMHDNNPYNVDAIIKSNTQTHMAKCYQTTEGVKINLYHKHFDRLPCLFCQL